MKLLPQIIQLANIISMVLLIIFITLQNRSQGLSTVFGGGGTVVGNRRGFEKWLFYATIIVAVLFAGLSTTSIIIATRS
ncbi:MAG: preprotein translocase subunit SecG [Candidatus Doudnabacteria bacterium]|nr:preprotein translocase subunit SecG [Candidatus Doudnabacteria bacterium]